jgi:TRAP-type mannitol/chloroaromatic compound transport system substrate-binding protein
MAFMSSWYEVGNIKALQEFENAGTEVIRLSDEDLKIIEGYAWEHLIAESASNPDYRAVALSMFQYLKDFRATRNFQVPFEHGRNPSTIPDLPGLK